MVGQVTCHYFLVFKICFITARGRIFPHPDIKIGNSYCERLEAFGLAECAFQMYSRQFLPMGDWMFAALTFLSLALCFVKALLSKYTCSSWGEVQHGEVAVNTRIYTFLTSVFMHIWCEWGLKPAKLEETILGTETLNYSGGPAGSLSGA